ncbi:carboxypeptidase regulatory-like domain-containing protein [Thermostichus vulcanus]|uniref:Carboxypeptidase regulatory-like domain-containing protein n=1 Tax=Thermostichus vulcanus str. 'Rupite' TaxID=2813851 RepID=A0ABT0CAB7_THEVL|nr:carboxypeptidase regulatory-like domain-containing protein [Thermostichus vulcanus]MCJ2542732.1 carboxypeptidase regulatory-like domain-containing protein [Thermostichus vulcanus str. 'Rupite']
MRWQWLVVVSGVLGLGSPVLGQAISAPVSGSPSSLEESAADKKGWAAETDLLLPLSSSADRIDGVTEQGWIAVGLLEDQAVTLLDLASGDPLWRVSVGFAPSIVRVDEARQLLYASGPNAPGLVAIDLLTGELIQAYGLAAGVLDIALDPATGRVFASMPSAQSLAVIQPDQPQARTLPMPGPPLALVYDPERGSLFVGLAGEDPLSLVVVNPDNGELLARWRGGDTPEMVALDAEQRRLVVLNSGSQDLTVLDLNQGGEALQRIGLDWRPTRLALSPDGRWAYVTSRDSDRLQVVNLETGRLEASLRLEGQPTGLAVLGTRDLLVVSAGIPALRWLEDIQGQARAAVANNGGSLDGAATANRGVVTGRVLDIAGQPVQTGVLTLNATATQPQQQVRIAADGTYVLPELPAGLYLVDVEVPGFPVTSTQVEVRAGFVATQDIRLPPGDPVRKPEGIGLLPDEPVYSDELARHLSTALRELQPHRQVMLLNGPLGPDPQFEPLLPLTRGLTLLDRDERYTPDLAKLKVIGDALGLRYILLTQMQISRDYSRQGSSLLNTALRFVAPMVPVEIPNFTPNQLRSRGLVVVVDLQRDRPGDRARYYEAYGRDDVGGDPMFEDAAAGLFRLQVRNMVPVFVDQWQSNNPFSGS